MGRFVFSALVGLGLLGAILAMRADASGCCDESPTWALAKTDYDPYGNSAVLVPANDTRVNLLLLLADRRRPERLAIHPAPAGDQAVMFTWNELTQRALPEPVTEDGMSSDYTEPSRCQTAGSGAAAFEAAVQANRRLSAADKVALVDARHALRPDCNSTSEGTQIPTPAVSSPVGKAFAAYVEGAREFYAGEFDDAARNFAATAKVDDPWLREAALYMVGRAELNRAQLSAFDEYGSLVEPEKRDRASAAAAEAGFAAYLRAYPHGRYFTSARGLLRRVYCLPRAITTRSTTRSCSPSPICSACAATRRMRAPAASR